MGRPLAHLPDNFGIVPNTIDVWTVPLGTQQPIIDRLRETLSADERDRGRRFHAQHHRDLYTASRGILRVLLSRYAEHPPAEISFGYASRGKPFLKSDASIHFNLGHSGELGVYAIAADEVGVDVEIMKPLADWQSISKRFFSSREATDLLGLNPDQQLAGFFSCWTRKEAYLKAIGDGLAAGLDKFYVGANPSIAHGVVEGGGKAEWYFSDLKVRTGYSAAVVSRSSKSLFRFFNFEKAQDCLDFMKR